MKIIKAYFGFLAGALLGLATLGLALMAVLAVAPEPLAETIQMAVFDDPYFFDSDVTSMALDNEMQDAATAHFSVMNWVATCHDHDSIADLSATDARHFEQYWPYARLDVRGPGDEFDRTAEKENAEFSLEQREHQLLRLSADMAAQRRYVAIRSTEVYASLERFALVTILIGLLTTVVVSVSTSEIFKGAQVVTTLRILSIVFPAIGTAAGAVEAFYRPSAELGQLSARAANLKQLHSEIAGTIWPVKCAKDDKGDDLGLKLTQWMDRGQKLDGGAVGVAGGAGRDTRTGSGTPPPPPPSPGSAAPAVPAGLSFGGAVGPQLPGR